MRRCESRAVALNRGWWSSSAKASATHIFEIALALDSACKPAVLPFFCAHPRLRAATCTHWDFAPPVCCVLLNAMPSDRYIVWKSKCALRAMPRCTPFLEWMGWSRDCLLWLSLSHLLGA